MASSRIIGLSRIDPQIHFSRTVACDECVVECDYTGTWTKIVRPIVCTIYDENGPSQVVARHKWRTCFNIVPYLRSFSTLHLRVRSSIHAEFQSREASHVTRSIATGFSRWLFSLSRLTISSTWLFWKAKVNPCKFTQLYLLNSPMIPASGSQHVARA